MINFTFSIIKIYNILIIPIIKLISIPNQSKLKRFSSFCVSEVIRKIICDAFTKNYILNDEIDLGSITVSFVNVSKDLKNVLTTTLERKSKDLAELVATIEAVSPLSVLSRGYSIISTEPRGEILSNSNQVKIGQTISAVLSEGKIKAEVKSKDKNNA